MSNPAHLERAGRAGVALAAGFAFFAAPNVAEAAVNLRTAGPFVVLAGSTVTNVPPTTLHGSLGLAPGSSVTGAPFVVPPGTTEIANPVAVQAKADLSTAFDEAAAEPVTRVLDSNELGGRVLVPGTYDIPGPAQLTGTLTLDASANPTGQYVFRTPSTLTTASDSSVSIIGGSACNVYFRVVSTAKLGTSTAFQGNILAGETIIAGSGTTVQGRLLAQESAVNLNNNVIDQNSQCAAAARTAGGSTGGEGSSSDTGSGNAGDDSSQGAQGSPASPAAAPASAPTPVPVRRASTRDGTAIIRRTPGEECMDGFTATVRGRQIARVTFRLDRKVIASKSASPFEVSVKAGAGQHNVTARVMFKDSTRAKTVSLGYRACAAAAFRPRRGPNQLTG